ncbi:hypothetical protein [Burkholderia cepacia]|uniref:hypothetical protein n=1 Tax=Burkholderia cepacia TaxID=292 RepID=UPI002AB6D404|nr:hypothetical protein [Burkholderia cepacia]
MRRASLLILFAGSVALGAAFADSPGDEFVGTWTSPQMVDTTLKITRITNGFAVQETQQNTFGGAQVHGAAAQLVKPGMLHVNGATVYRYEKDGGRLVIMVAPDTFAVFTRVAP